MVDAINRGGITRFVRKPWNRHEMHSLLEDSWSLHQTRTENAQLVLRLQEQLTAVEEERVRAEAAEGEALQAADARARVLANVSHEVRTPLNGIIGLAELLCEMTLPAPAPEYSRLIHTSGQGLLATLDDVLDLSKIDAGELQLTMTSFDPADVVMSVLELFGPGAQDKGIQLFGASSPRTPARVKSDPGRLRQIVANLVSNAIKFTPDGEVVVEIDLEDDSLRVTVADTGPGIEPPDLERIFGAYERANDRAGVGLGLAIARQLAEAMDGRLQVNSTVGVGTTFTLTLPVQVDRHSSHQLSAAPQRILMCCHATAGARRMLRALLDAGHTARLVAPDGGVQRALDEGRGGRAFDLLILAPDLQVDAVAARRPLGLRVVQAHWPSHGTGAGVVPLRLPWAQSRLLDAVSLVRSRGNPAAVAHRARVLMSRIRVLIAEDNVVNQLVLRRQVEALGCDVDVVGNGIAALSAVRAARYDIVLMDCQMPQMDGYGATRAIRDEEKDGTRLPIVAVTAHAMKGDREHCLESGMDDYMSKPCPPGGLESILRKWTSWRTAHEDAAGEAEPTS